MIDQHTLTGESVSVEKTKGEVWADKAALPILCTGVLSAPLMGSSKAMAILNGSPGNLVRVFASLNTPNHIIFASQKGLFNQRWTCS